MYNNTDKKKRKYIGEIQGRRKIIYPYPRQIGEGKEKVPAQLRGKKKSK